MNPQLISVFDSIKTKKSVLFIQIVLVFIAPLILIHLGIIPISYRVVALSVIVFLLLLILIKEHWTRAMFEVTLTNAKKYFWQYVIFTIIGVFAISIFGEHFIGREELQGWWHYNHFLYLFFIVSLLQEVAYRGYLIPALGALSRNPLWIILANALLFTYLHTIFPGLLVNLPLAFVGGIGFAIMYLKYPSLPLIILSHAALNFIAVLLGFFIIPGITY